MKEPSETTPAELLSDFNSRGLKGMIIFTIVVHVVVVLATSGSYIWRKVTGTDASKLGESERLELAVKETQSAMRRIAEQHGIKPQELGSRFANPSAPSKAEPKPEPKTEPKAELKTEPGAEPKTPPPAPEEPKSTIEKQLKKAEPGPTVPADEDLFK
jgi:hypothetical protein